MSSNMQARHIENVSRLARIHAARNVLALPVARSRHPLLSLHATCCPFSLCNTLHPTRYMSVEAASPCLSIQLFVMIRTRLIYSSITICYYYLNLFRSEEDIKEHLCYCLFHGLYDTDTF